MPGYHVKFETVMVGGGDYQIRSLANLQQYSDPSYAAEQAGISSASWPLFGHLWPSARILAQFMDTFKLNGKRILEIGAGLALASLVIHRWQGNVTASDWHPLSQVFLNESAVTSSMNADSLNNLPLSYIATRQNPLKSSSLIQTVAIVWDFVGQWQDWAMVLRLNAPIFLMENGEPYKGRLLTFS